MSLRYPSDFSEYSPCLLRHRPFQNAREPILAMRRRSGDAVSLADTEGGMPASDPR